MYAGFDLTKKLPAAQGLGAAATFGHSTLGRVRGNPFFVVAQF